MFSGREKTFAAIILLFAASAVSASPTIVSVSPACSCSVPISSDHADGVVACDLGYNAVCDRISVFGKAFFQLPLPDGRTPAVTENNRCLPAVPPSIAMVLTGFLCISLVRDRKVWLTVLAGLLAIGQAGINALPELTSRLGRRFHNAQPVDMTFTAFCPVEGVFYPANYSKEIRYTGLLHHLAGIPRDTSVFSHNAIIHVQFALSRLLNCLVSGTGQFVCFSPISWFNLIPRGPPIPKMKLFYKHAGVQSRNTPARVSRLRKILIKDNQGWGLIPAAWWLEKGVTYE